MNKYSKNYASFFLCSFIFFLCNFAALASAETVYVSDQLVITLRQGKSTKHKIIKTLQTGTSMEVLESAKDDPYIKVRLTGGEVGYVLSQYISTEIPKSTVISRLQTQISDLQEKLSSLENARNLVSDDFQEIKSAKEAYEKDLGQTKAELEELSQKYKTLLKQSEQVVTISKERDDFQKSQTMLLAEVKELRDENYILKKASLIKWFLAGAGVFFFGWLAGKFSKKKKQGLTL